MCYFGNLVSPSHRFPICKVRRRMHTLCACYEQVCPKGIWVPEQLFFLRDPCQYKQFESFQISVSTAQSYSIVGKKYHTSLRKWIVHQTLLLDSNWLRGSETAPLPRVLELLRASGQPSAQQGSSERAPKRRLECPPPQQPCWPQLVLRKGLRHF